MCTLKAVLIHWPIKFVQCKSEEQSSAVPDGPAYNENYC